MALPYDKQFPVFARGDVRELILAAYRIGLQGQTNPDTGLLFTEGEIAAATMKGSSRWVEADAIDQAEQGSQHRAVWLAMQNRPDLASTAALKNIWGPLYLPGGYLPASGGSGPVLATAQVGVPWTGSTTLPDTTPGVVYGTDPSGRRYQVLFSAVTDSAGQVELTVAALDPGPDSNIEAGVEITWANAPVGADLKATVSSDFTGGNNAENDADFSKRLIRAIRHKQAAGNNAQMAAWAEGAAGNAVERAFVYACAFHAGSTLVVPVQKRGAIKGPTGRAPTLATLAAVRAVVVPPGSTVVPAPPHVVVVPPVRVATNMVISLALPKGQSSGWTDFQPWPGQSAGTPASVTAITNQTHFQITSLLALPAGVTAPAMMLWDVTTSRFVELLVTSVVVNAGNVYDVVLTAAPATHTIAIGDWVSPATELLEVIATTAEVYADSLGPGEVVDLTTDPRAHRAFRFPEPGEEYPQRAGTAVLTYLQDALGGSLADESLDAISVQAPALPVDGNGAADPIQGPTLLVLGKIMVSSL